MQPEVTWKQDAAVEAARKQPGWVELHKACAPHKLFFDHITKSGRFYVCDVYTGSGRETAKRWQGAGSTPVEALIDGYRQSKWQIPEAEVAIARLQGGPVDEYEELLG